VINYLPNGKIYIKIEVSRMKREKQSNERKKKNSDSGSEIMQNLNNTQYFKIVPEQELKTEEVLALVYEALTEKGYDPVSQIVGYIMSGDPTYITSHKNARSLIMKVERDELLEEVLQYYISHKIEG
jgi:uncharacterized protein (UPF0297 family)